MKLHLLSLSLLCIVSTTAAQPTLTAANSNPHVGDYYYSYICHATAVPAPAAGANVIWNYTSLTDSAIDTVWVEACSPASQCDSFPGSTFMTVTQPKNFYQSFIADTINLLLTGQLLIDSPWYTYVYYSKPFTFLKYPVTYGSIWRDTFLFAVPSNNCQHTFEDCYHKAEGYGTLTVPGGTYTNVLLIHLTDYSSDTSFSCTTPSLQIFRREIYMWYKPGIHYPVFTIEHFYDSVNGWVYGYVNVNSGSLIPGFFPTFPAGINTFSDMDGNVSVYPNPAKDLIHIKLNVAYKPYYDCDVVLLDITGRQVAVSENGNGWQNDEAVIQTSFLPPGIYLLRVKTPSGTVTKKIQISK